MSESTDSLFKFMQKIEAEKNLGAVFLAKGVNFTIRSAKIDDDQPGIWQCVASAGPNLVIKADEVLAIVEHPEG